MTTPAASNVETGSFDLSVMPGRYAVCRLDAAAAVPAWATRGAFWSVTRTPSELSVVCESSDVPPGVRAEHDWRVLSVLGPLDFALVGVVSQLVGPLAAAGVSVFVMSTFDTDHLLVREPALGKAIDALRAAGHHVGGTPADKPEHEP